jgi:hypothetical protein
MRLSGKVLIAIALTTLALPADRGTPEAQEQSKLVSIFPLGCERGAKLEAVVRGSGLNEVSAVWVDTQDLKARINRVEPLASEESDSPPKINVTARVVLEMEISAVARLGTHSVRLVTPQGISNSLEFTVSSDACVMETQADHSSFERAQSITSHSLVNGRISKKGQVDYYAVDVAKGQTLIFEARSNTKAQQGSYDSVEIGLYELAASWFDAQHLARLSFANFYINKQFLRHRFATAGRYYLQVGMFMGAGGPDNFYQLRVSEDSHPGAFADDLELTDRTGTLQIAGHQ